jgi:hypothetical protein
LKNPSQKSGWWSGFKVKALSSSPNTGEKKKQKKKPLQYHQNETTKMTFNLKCVQELIIKPNIINLLGEKEKAS